MSSGGEIGFPPTSLPGRRSAAATGSPPAQGVGRSGSRDGGIARLIMNDGPCPAERFAPAALRVAECARRLRRSSMLLPPRHPPVSRDPVSDPVSLRFFQKTHGLAQAARLPGAAFQVFPAFSHKTSPLRIRTGHCSRPSRSKSRCLRRIVDVLAHDYQTPDACSGANHITCSTLRTATDLGAAFRLFARSNAAPTRSCL